MLSNSTKRNSDIGSATSGFISIIIGFIICLVISSYFPKLLIREDILLLIAGGIAIYWFIGTIIFYKMTNLKFEAIKNFSICSLTIFLAFLYFLGINSLTAYVIPIVIYLLFIRSIEPFIRKEKRENQKKWERLYQMSSLDFLLFRFPDVKELK